jgi:hypothetical protein
MNNRRASWTSRVCAFVAGGLFVFFFLGGATCNRVSETTVSDPAEASRESSSLPLPA